jgi:hypothetical protein
MILGKLWMMNEAICSKYESFELLKSRRGSALKSLL